MHENKNGRQSCLAPNAMMLRRTLFLLVVCGIVAFLVLGMRLFKLQILDHDKYESMAIEQQVRGTTVKAARGTIYDTNMKILAMSANVNDIFISPAEISMYDEDPEFIARGLSEILDVDYEKILERCGNKKSWYQTVAKQIEPEVTEQVRQFKIDNDLKGVKIEESTKRYYPYSSLAAQVIGFVGTDNQGLSGMEIKYEEMLTGTDGRVVRAKNAAGTDMLFTSFEDYIDPVDGLDVVSTLDYTIQHYVEKHLMKAVQDYDVQNGAGAIVMDVDTGAILAWASLPNFDLNNYQLVDDDVRILMEAADSDEQRAEILSNAQFKQWRNKTLSDTYEPGSTFKILTLSMALNEGVVDLNDNFFCGGTINVTGRDKPVKCWKHGGHGSQTLTQALQHSCNVAFVQIGAKVGAEKFYDYCEKFGFFESSTDPDARLSGKTGIELGGESQSIWWPRNDFCNPNDKSSLAAASFGQTFNITPLQLITAVSACCNGGNLMKPYIVKETINPDGTSNTKTEPQLIRQVISSKTSETVCSMLEQVVGAPEGTGKNARVAGYRVGGKTGTSEKTAQNLLLENKEYFVSFMGIAPADDPKIAVLVILDTPTNKPGIYISGGQMAAPVVGNILSDVLPYMGYEPVYTEEEEENIDRAVPNITGMSRDEAAGKLKESGFTYRVIGEGSEVTNQLPAANSIVAADSQMIVYCDASPSQEMETMPDIKGLTYSVARQRLGAYGLFIRCVGSAVDPTTVVVTRQNLSAGSSVSHGTVVEVSVSDISNLGTY